MSVLGWWLSLSFFVFLVYNVKYIITNTWVNKCVWLSSEWVFQLSIAYSYIGISSRVTHGLTPTDTHPPIWIKLTRVMSGTFKGHYQVLRDCLPHNELTKGSCVSLRHGIGKDHVILQHIKNTSPFAPFNDGSLKTS